ncbi:hypothetical protein WAI453_001639 [Rhynchosporium graminicola]
MERCSKRQKNVTHLQRTCPTPWPASEFQECDLCLKSTSNKHEARDCTSWSGNNAWYDTCGHTRRWKKTCPIKDKPIEFSLRRKAAYEEKLKKNDKGFGVDFGAIDHQRHARYQQRIHFEEIYTHDLEDRRLTSRQVPKEEIEKVESSKANLDLCECNSSNKPSPNSGDRATANFFKFWFDASKTSAEYRTIRGKFHTDRKDDPYAVKARSTEDPAKNRDRPPKRETIRALIE